MHYRQRCQIPPSHATPGSPSKLRALHNARLAFSSVNPTLVPLLAMTLVAGFWIWRDRAIEDRVAGTLTLDSPISLPKVVWFGLLFIVIQVVGTLLTRFFGSYGMLATGIFGGLVSSASTTAAASTMAMHGKISAALA
ncbi:MAG TPA: DUF4010 domain-containing protein, partial [Terriglobales bacterium]|nr:DUF4010 domain-containing protein [Terriglobales bacterium]